VPARHQKGNKRKGRRIRFKERREQVALHVMDRHGRDVEAKGQSFGHRSAGHQGTHEPRARGEGNAAKGVERPARSIDRFANEWDELRM
jgi:hypothetical protein